MHKTLSIIPLLLAFAMLLIPSGGNTPFTGCGTSAKVCQTGTVTVTMTAGTNTATSSAITFSPAFSVVPVEVATCKQFCKTNTITPSFPTSAIEIVSPNSTQCSLTACGGAGSGIAGVNNWDNPPAATTEFFPGSPFFEHEADFTDVKGFRFGVDCILGSSSSTATFTLQYSIDFGLSWHILNGLQNVNVGSSCQSILTSSFGLGSLTYSSLPVNASGNVALRLAEFNGGGAGDQILFGRVWTDLQLQSAGDTGNNVCSPSIVPSALVPKSSFQIRIECVDNTISSFTFTVFWIAHI
jgi:hypothetical protein